MEVNSADAGRAATLGSYLSLHAQTCLRMLPLTVIKSGGNAELSGAAICLPPEDGFGDVL